MQNIVTFAQALQKIKDVTPLISKQTINLSQALGRITSSDIYSSINNPPFNAAAVDGIAISLQTYEHLQKYPNTKLKIIHTILAGDSINTNLTLKVDECLYITTGAMVPETIATIIMIEHTTPINPITVIIQQLPAVKSNIRPSGDDYQHNQLLIAKGTKLNCNDIALLASSGHHTVEVYNKPKVAFFTTGKETLSIDQPLTPGKIFNSNEFLLFNFLNSLGCEIVLTNHIKDDIAYLDNQVHEALQYNVDFIVSAGAVSMGKEDIVKTYLLQKSQIIYQSVKLRPGKPNMLGLINNKTLYFGLPGNPVSCAIGLCVFVHHYWRAAHGLAPLTKVKAVLQQNINKKTDFVILLRAHLNTDEHGLNCVTPLEAQGSHMLYGLHQANCLIYTPANKSTLYQGEIVEVYLI